jgi:hypothetical protein
MADLKETDINQAPAEVPVKEQTPNIKVPKTRKRTDSAQVLYEPEPPTRPHRRLHLKRSVRLPSGQRGKYTLTQSGPKSSARSKSRSGGERASRPRSRKPEYRSRPTISGRRLPGS